MPRRSFRIWALVAVASLIVTAALMAQYGGGYTWSPQRYWEGRPDFSRGDSFGYFVWNDPDGWHLRWTVPNGRTVSYSGTIRCNGTFTNMGPTGFEPGDTFRRATRGSAEFYATAHFGDQDGVDFRMDRDASYVVFDLKIDGHTAKPYQIRVGAESTRPYALPVRIDRSPATPSGWW
jgi:hypothetical protein